LYDNKVKKEYSFMMATSANNAVSASALFPMSVPQVRKNLQLMRTAWSQHSPENIFYPSAPLPTVTSNNNNNTICSFELFSYHQVKGNHNKRHQKRKSVPYQLANSTVIFEKEDENDP
jgi:hypothetical protein